MTMTSDRWWEFGECRGKNTDDFFPPDHSGRPRPEAHQMREARAKMLCARCVVRNECLDDALLTPGTRGIWGGMTEQERTVEMRKRVDAGTWVGRKQNLAGLALIRECSDCGMIANAGSITNHQTKLGHVGWSSIAV